MEWTQLLCQRRMQADRFEDETPDDHRTEFQRDYDRVLFSSAFRRLHDKTQVFPMPEDDHVHSRLTHSLEVSSVGRTLGIAVGREILRENPSLESTPGIDEQAFGDIVAAACLAHDIGNPPFGHSGERAIAQFFELDPEGKQALSRLDHEAERCDFTKFEGNAQGFRILVRTHNRSNGGMQLTAATLAAFIKYPRESMHLEQGAKPATDVASKKYGFFQSERSEFLRLAKHVGLAENPAPKGVVFPGPAPLAYCRHPLAFLVEAADDISYRILDIEDGVRLGLAPHREAEQILENIASRKHSFRKPGTTDLRDRIAYLRGKAITQLRDEVVRVFLDHQRSILSGTYSAALLDGISLSKRDLDDLAKLMAKHCYEHRSVVEIEQAGFHVLGGLLRIFISLVCKDTLSSSEQKLLRLIGYEHERHGCLYDRLQQVTDYVSGMTDRYAVASYRRLQGISLPGSAQRQ